MKNMISGLGFGSLSASYQVRPLLFMFSLTIKDTGYEIPLIISRLPNCGRTDPHSPPPSSTHTLTSLLILTHTDPTTSLQHTHTKTHSLHD